MPNEVCLASDVTAQVLRAKNGKEVRAAQRFVYSWCKKCGTVMSRWYGRFCSPEKPFII